VQIGDAAQLRRQWGDRPCDHPRFSKEYHLGADTGDYICEQCGKCFAPQEMRQIEEERSRASTHGQG
jgi:hypothetical protein